MCEGVTECVIEGREGVTVCDREGGCDRGRV